MKDAKLITKPKTSTNKPNLFDYYNEEFYRDQVASSLSSARIYLTYLWQYLQPTSVCDVGCGRGAWLKACGELGSKKLLGLDGDWNSQKKMIESSIVFRTIDLNHAFSIDQKVDLAITLEVAEHLDPTSAPNFVECLTKASDAILFGSAYVAQGGANHINEQPHTYWANIFLTCNFVPFDFFRPVFWGDKNVCYWYRQNTFLYIRKDSVAYQALVTAGFSELKNISFMDCIHPNLYNRKLVQKLGFKDHITDLFPSFYRSIKSRL